MNHFIKIIGVIDNESFINDITSNDIPLHVLLHNEITLQNTSYNFDLLTNITHNNNSITCTLNQEYDGDVILCNHEKLFNMFNNTSTIDNIYHNHTIIKQLIINDIVLDNIMDNHSLTEHLMNINPIVPFTVEIIDSGNLFSGYKGMVDSGIVESPVFIVTVDSGTFG